AGHDLGHAIPLQRRCRAPGLRLARLRRERLFAHVRRVHARVRGPLGMKVRFLELRPAYLELKDAIDAAVARVLDSGWYINGYEVEAFETEWAQFCGARHAVGVGNGL